MSILKSLLDNMTLKRKKHKKYCIGSTYWQNNKHFCYLWGIIIFFISYGRKVFDHLYSFVVFHNSNYYLLVVS